MSWYSRYKAEWKEIIETVARESKRSELMVEKDTIQSMFLYGLAQSELSFVFKGGTALSKSYNLIDRFSEDLDLSMSRKPTESEKKASKKRILEISDSLGMTLSNPERIKSRFDYNMYIFLYESLFDTKPKEIIVETNYYQVSYPVERREVESFVGKFCSERNIKLPIPFKSASIQMDVQSLERTFIDKVFAICDYRLQDMQNRDSRHLYDICKILDHVKLDKKMRALADRVRKDRMQSKNNPSAQLEHNIPDMLEEIIRSRFYESDYKNLTQKLLYEDMDYDFVIENGIGVVASTEVFEKPMELNRNR